MLLRTQEVDFEGEDVQSKVVNGDKLESAQFLGQLANNLMHNTAVHEET